MEFDHWSEKNVKKHDCLMDTPSVKKPPKTYAETPPNLDYLLGNLPRTPHDYGRKSHQVLLISQMQTAV